MHSQTEIRKSSVNWTQNLHSQFIWKLLSGGQPQVKGTSHSLPTPYSGKHGGPRALCCWKEWEMEGKGQRHPTRRACGKGTVSLPWTFSINTKVRRWGTFSISAKRLQGLPKVYHPQIHQFVVLQELPDPLEQKTSGSPTLALTIVCGYGGGGTPLADFWVLLIHFLFSLAGHFNLDAECTARKKRLVRGWVNALWTWALAGVTFFEQPGKMSLGRHSTMPPWTWSLGIHTHHGSPRSPQPDPQRTTRCSNCNPSPFLRAVGSKH